MYSYTSRIVNTKFLVIITMLDDIRWPDMTFFRLQKRYDICHPMHVVLTVANSLGEGLSVPIDLYTSVTVSLQETLVIISGLLLVLM